MTSKNKHFLFSNKTLSGIDIRQYLANLLSYWVYLVLKVFCVTFSSHAATVGVVKVVANL